MIARHPERASRTTASHKLRAYRRGNIHNAHRVLRRVISAADRYTTSLASGYKRGVERARRMSGPSLTELSERRARCSSRIRRLRHFAGVAADVVAAAERAESTGEHPRFAQRDVAQLEATIDAACGEIYAALHSVWPLYDEHD